MRPGALAWELGWLACCILPGLVLRLLALHQERAWGDESLTAACLPAEGLGGYLTCAFERDPTIRLAPLYHGVQYGWSVVFGGDLYSLRMLSVALSCAAMIQLYFLARTVAGLAVARWSVVLFGMSLFQIYYGQEVRVYALLNVLALASVQATRAYAIEEKPWGLWAGIAFNAGLLLTHSFTLLFIATLGLYVVLCGRPQALRWLCAQAGLGVGFVAWVLLIGYDLGAESQAYTDRGAGLRELAATALQFAGGRFSNYNPGDFVAGGINLELVILSAVVLLGGLALGRIRRSEGTGGQDGIARSDLVLLFLWLVMPVVLLFLIGSYWRPCFYSRYLVYSAIPVGMLTAIGLNSISFRLVRRLAASLLVLMLVWQNLALPRPFRADYGMVERVVASDPAAEKAVLALKPFNHRAVAYALREHDVEAELLYGLKEVIGVAQQRAEAGLSVWVVFYHWDRLEPFAEAMEDAGLAAQAIRSAGMPPLTVYHVHRNSPMP